MRKTEITIAIILGILACSFTFCITKAFNAIDNIETSIKHIITLNTVYKEGRQSMQNEIEDRAEKYYYQKSISPKELELIIFNESQE